MSGQHPSSIGRFAVKRFIEDGGMGRLYVSWDDGLQREVAIKVLQSRYNHGDFRQRFVEEGQKAAKLKHTNIVTVYESGEQDGLPYLVMEYVSGDTFAEILLRQQHLPVLEALKLTEAVCAGLTHCHSAGVIHRDIKPTNLKRNLEDTVKILDFGVAKLLSSDATMYGAPIGGTPNYMAPEQARGNEVDARADVFSLGAVLFELLSGRRAFPGKVPQRVIESVKRGLPTPITAYCPRLDEALAFAVAKALEVDPDRRYPSAEAFRGELEDVRLRLSPPRTPGRLPLPQEADATATVPHIELDETVGASSDSLEADRMLLEAKELADRGELERGSALLTRVLAAHPTHAGGLALKERLLLERLAAAEDWLAKNDLDGASREIAAAMSLSPVDRRVSSLAGALDNARLRETRHTECRQMLSAALAQIEHGGFDEAARLLGVAEELNPSEQQIAEVRQGLAMAREHHEAVLAEERRRAQVAELVKNAQRCLESGELADARGLADQALALDEDDGDAQSVSARIGQATDAVLEDARIATEIENARRRFARGQHEAAFDLLRSLDPHPKAAFVIHELRERRQQQESVTALVEQARAALQEARFEDALHLLESAPTLDPPTTEAREIPVLRDQALKAQADARLRQQAEALADQIEQSLLTGTTADAREPLSRLRVLGIDTERSRDVLRRFDAAVAHEQAERRGAKRLANEKAAARKAIEQGKLDAAANHVRAAKQLDASDSDIETFEARLERAVTQAEDLKARTERERQLKTRLASAERLLRSAALFDIERAQIEIQEAFKLEPNNDHASALEQRAKSARERAERNEAIRTEIRNARRRFSNGLHDAAFELLERLPPDRPEVVAALEEMQIDFERLQGQRSAVSAYWAKLSRRIHARVIGG